MSRVRGSMKEVKPVDINVDTVYVRSNIVRIEEEDFVGWEYDEQQYEKNEYFEHLSTENQLLKEALEVILGGE